MFQPVCLGHRRRRTFHLSRIHLALLANFVVLRTS